MRVEDALGDTADAMGAAGAAVLPGSGMPWLVRVVRRSAFSCGAWQSQERREEGSEATGSSSTDKLAASTRTNPLCMVVLCGVPLKQSPCSNLVWFGLADRGKKEGWRR